MIYRLSEFFALSFFENRLQLEYTALARPYYERLWFFQRINSNRAQMSLRPELSKELIHRIEAVEHLCQSQ